MPVAAPAHRDLKSLLQYVLATQFDGVQARLAETLDLNETWVSRLLRGITSSMSVEACLHLARTCDLNPDEVLGLAGKADTAKLIRALYGKAAPVRGGMTEEEREWVAVLKTMPAAHRRSFLAIAHALPKA